MLKSSLHQYNSSVILKNDEEMSVGIKEWKKLNGQSLYSAVSSSFQRQRLYVWGLYTLQQIDHLWVLSLWILTFDWMLSFSGNGNPFYEFPFVFNVAWQLCVIYALTKLWWVRHLQKTAIATLKVMPLKLNPWWNPCYRVSDCEIMHVSQNWLSNCGSTWSNMAWDLLKHYEIR